MNHQFQGSRSPMQGGSMPFYNPQKDSFNPNNPVLYQNSNSSTPSVPGFLPNSTSKSFISRSNILDPPKPANNTSAYLKNTTEQPIQPPKFPNTVTSPTGYSNNAYGGGFQQPFPTKPAEMAKSSFHENNKGSESTIGFSPQGEKTSFVSNTPPRRAPRMSEPGIFDPNQGPSYTKTFDFKQPVLDKTTESPLQKRPKDLKEFQNNFFKNKAAQKEEKNFKLEGSTGGLGRSEITGSSSGRGELTGSNSGKGEGLGKIQGKLESKGEISGNMLGKSQVYAKSSLGKRRPLFVSDFLKIKQLGSGKYGQVSLVQQKNTGFVCALKKIQKKLLKQEQITQQFIRELKIQMYLGHPNIIRMYGYFDDESYIYIILQVGTGGQLYHQLRKSQPMGEVKVAGVMKQVCEAVNEIHSLKIIHRDIKPENIVLHENVIKLCDFGWSVYQDNRLRTTFCGTPLYVCPQILRGKEYDEKIDIWSLGIMMYEMLVGENPFKITKEEELIKIVKEEISIPSYVFVSREGRDFLDKCLKKNPADRVSIKELLNHQFFVKNAEKDKEKKMTF